ncbi:MAG: DUF2806 domain-containing protein [Spirulina sp. SIO3F2]|nr:DUF2806 domain-containing protein [Spirulina sp. SIO3F2]
MSEPLTRLIEVISQGIGAVSAPYLTRQNANAKAHEIRVITAALKEAGESQNLPVHYQNGELEMWQKPEDHQLLLEPQSVDERADSRLDYQERRRQANIENVTSIAAAELASAESVAEDSPDEDWVTRFFNSAQDVSSEQMQALWGRILAGEIRQPGTYSLRTLEVIRNLSQEEAEVIALVGKMAIVASDQSAFVSLQNRQWLSDQRNIERKYSFLLVELGILYPSELEFQVFSDEDNSITSFQHGQRLLRIERGEINQPIRFRIWGFTEIGKEILSFISFDIDDEYLEQLGLFFVARKGKAYIGNLKNTLSSGKIEYEIIREIVKVPTN